MTVFGVAGGWWMIGGAAVLVGIVVYLTVKHDFDSIEGIHFSAKTNDENKLAALGLIVCAIGAAALFYIGRRAL